MMATGFFSFATCDALAKFLTTDFSAVQLVWFRMLGLFAGVCVLLVIRGGQVLATPRPGYQVARGVVAVGSALCFIQAIRFVPLADAVAVSFIAPFIVTILGAVLLGETVGPRRWAAVGIGFVGMLLVIRPGAGVFHPAVLLVVIAAFLFAARQLISRWLSGVDSVQTTIAYTSITGTLLVSALLPFVWVTPETPQVWLIISAMMVFSAFGELMVICALDIARAAVLAPMHYTLILWSTLYGFVLFGDFPDLWAILGCTVIIISGLYSLSRERLLLRRKSGSPA